MGGRGATYSGYHTCLLPGFHRHLTVGDSATCTLCPGMPRQETVEDRSALLWTDRTLLEIRGTFLGCPGQPRICALFKTNVNTPSHWSSEIVIVQLKCVLCHKIVWEVLSVCHV